MGFEVTSARIGLCAVVVSLTCMVVGSLLFPDKKKPDETAGLEAAKGVS